MIDAKRIAELKEKAERFRAFNLEDYADLLSILSLWKARAEENERLRGDWERSSLKVAEWFARMEHAESLCLMLKARAEKAEAEVGRLDGAYKWLSQTNTELVEMREKAEGKEAKER